MSDARSGNGSGDGKGRPGREAFAPVVPRRKRFYTEVAVAPVEGGFGITLDGRPLRTPSRNRLVLPTAALGEAIAEEWQAQGELINPAVMPLTRLANTAVDGVAPRMAEVAADAAKYAGSDLVCYRAERPEALARRQAAAWDPVLDWARQALGCKLAPAASIMPVAQRADEVAKVATAVGGLAAWPLTALHVMTTLTGSVLLALAVVRGRLSVEEAWAAAHIDEDWQIEQWGVDEEAAARRAGRRTEMQAAGRLVELLQR